MTKGLSDIIQGVAAEAAARERASERHADDAKRPAGRGAGTRNWGALAAATFWTALIGSVAAVLTLG